MQLHESPPVEASHPRERDWALSVNLGRVPGEGLGEGGAAQRIKAVGQLRGEL